MRIGLFLPHVGVYGGVRRYLELGNVWARTGHHVTLFHPSGEPPEWLGFEGAVARLDRATAEPSDLALCSDPHTYASFRAHPARHHLYYCVLERDPGVGAALRDPDVRLAANSSGLVRWLARRTPRPVLNGAGGIHLGQFHPNPARRARAPLRVLVNGRRSRPKKGTDLILRALKGLRGTPDFDIVLFDRLDPARPEEDPRDGVRLPARARYVIDPSQEELVALYQSSHVFVAAERKAGWCNTAIEAMACGAAVACTRSGTLDFARHERTALLIPHRHAWFVRRAVRRLLVDESLRSRLGAAGPEAAEPWSWDRLAARLLEPFHDATHLHSQETRR